MKHIFLTGHTGFKGTWFAHLLRELGFAVSGYSDEVKPGGVFEQTEAQGILTNHYIGDVRDIGSLKSALKSSQCDTFVHFAAQPIVISSYENPEATFDINVRGTWNGVVAASEVGIQKMLVITTDKVYRDLNTKVPYSEVSPLGGFDPYAASKAAADIVTQSLASSLGESFKIQVARAGNVIGGGDTSLFRLVPDVENAISLGVDLRLRNGNQVRPWQHVLDCLSGYLAIMDSNLPSNQWNVGPMSESPSIPVTEFASRYLMARNSSAKVVSDISAYLETEFLQLDTRKIQNEIFWKPKWDTETAIQKTAEWYNLVDDGLQPREIIKHQILSYLGR